jgi:hypothetical protein
MFIAALVTILKQWNQPTQSTVDELIMKIWYVCAMEYYSTIKKCEFHCLEENRSN